METGTERATPPTATTPTNTTKTVTTPARARRRSGFLRRAEGGIAMSTAILMPMLLMGAVVAVDMGEVYRAKTNYQMAADAAALRAAKMVTTGSTKEEAKEAATAIFYQNMGNIRQSGAQIDFELDSNCTDKPVVANVKTAHPLHFSGIHQVGNRDGEFEITIKSEVRCANDTLEIAMVLDNSGSMNSSGKMVAMRKAAKELVQDIDSAMKHSPKAKALQFALVPFSASVNVGKNARSADWIDSEGRSPIHHADLDWSTWPEGATQRSDGTWRDSNGKYLTRFTIFDTLKDYRGRDIEWQGCVQMRPYPHHTRDTPPEKREPETLFVPAFVADEPDELRGRYYQYRKPGTAGLYCRDWRIRSQKGRRFPYCYQYSDFYKPPGKSGRHHTGVRENPYNGKYDQQWQYVGAGAVVTTNKRIEEIRNGWGYYAYSYLDDGLNMPTDLCQGLITHEDCAGKDKGTWKGQHRRQRWTHKYYKSRMRRQNRSPNSECTTQPITPLSTNMSAVQRDIDRMKPTGTTNITQGVGWGWRTLSPGAPYTGGRPYSDGENRKIMIVLTDGSHFYNSHRTPNKSMVGGWGLGVHDGTPADGFMFKGFDGKRNPSHSTGTYQEAMDEHMSETCGNARAANITIYTIAFAVRDAKTKRTMQDCASTIAGAKAYYDAGSNVELAKAFKSITESIQALRISK